jgi:hypothetical protein
LLRGWRKIARDRDAWTLILKEVRVLDGPYGHWKRRRWKTRKRRKRRRSLFFLANTVIAEYFYHRVTKLGTILFPGFLGS